MNFAIQNIFTSIFSLALAITIILTGCNKDEEEGPVITNIRAISPAPNDSSLTRINSGDLIVIQGRNLATVQYVYFNGTAANLNPALAADDNVVVTVPDIPYSTISEDELNKIRLVTEYGETTYSFPVEPPAPILTSISNEFTPPGETMVMYGQYFFLVESIIFAGGAEVTDFTVNEGGTTISFIVPMNAQPGDVVVDAYAGTSTYKTYMPQDGIISNFDDIMGPYAYWGPTAMTDDPTLYPGNFGNYVYLQANAIPPNNFEWWNTGRSINFNVATLIEPEHLDEPVSSYALKFEIFVKEPWSKGTIMVRLAEEWIYIARYEPHANGAFETDGWRTVVIPFDRFRTNGPDGTNGTGNPAGSLDELFIMGEGQATLGIMLINDSDETLDYFDAAFDTFRIANIE